jgi:hypothetical protein
MQIVDNQDMTILSGFSRKTDIASVSLELIAAIKQGYLTVKAAGCGAAAFKFRRWKHHPRETAFLVLTWITNT